MSSDRLLGLAKNIREQTEIVNQYELDVVSALKRGEKFKLKLQLEAEEEQLAELWQKFEELRGQEAEAAIAEIIEATPNATQDPEIPAEIRHWMKKIYAAVSQPEAANAAVKLKPFLSLTPPFFGLMVEGEVDVERTLQKYFPTFLKLGEAVRRLPKRRSLSSNRR